MNAYLAAVKGAARGRDNHILKNVWMFWVDHIIREPLEGHPKKGNGRSQCYRDWGLVMGRTTDAVGVPTSVPIYTIAVARVYKAFGSILLTKVQYYFSVNLFF